MLNVPFVEDSALQKFMDEIDKMRRGKSRERLKPHKLVLLLAILNLFDQGVITENRIYFNNILFDAFKNIFVLIGKEDDWCQPAPPYFHLRSSDFWKHKIIKGRDEEYGKLRSSGGGAKRITDNIEYAYFSNYAFEVLCHPQLRKILREQLFLLLNPAYEYKGAIPNVDLGNNRKSIKEKGEGIAMNQRIGTMFHETFAFNRDAVHQVLYALASNFAGGIPEGCSVSDFFQERTNLGANYIKSMPKYAIGSGLLDFEYKFTTFGRAVWKYNQLLDHPSTQWLLHYFLSAPCGPGPLFWSKLVCNFFTPDTLFSGESVISFLSVNIESSKGQSIAEDSLSSTKTIFIRTYTKLDAFGNLGLITEQENKYQVNYPETPSVWAMAVAFIDYCRNQFPGVKVINLDNLLDDSDFGKIFMVGARRINRMLSQMQEAGYVEIFNSVPPYGVAILRTDIEPLLEKMYGNEESD